MDDQGRRARESFRLNVARKVAESWTWIGREIGGAPVVEPFDRSIGRFNNREPAIFAIVIALARAVNSRPWLTAEH